MKTNSHIPYLFMLGALAIGISSCTNGTTEIMTPAGIGKPDDSATQDDDAFAGTPFDESSVEQETNDDDNKASRTAFPGTRVKDVSDDVDFDDFEDESSNDGRAKDSDCEFFTSGGSLALTEKPDNFVNTSTIIDHFPPAEYPMPVHETFAGEWDGDRYKFIALVDIKISYSAHDPYETKWKTALPDSEEDPLYERRYYNVTIQDADYDSCTVSYTKDER